METDKGDVKWTGIRKNGHSSIMLMREHIRVKIYPGFGFMNIYRNITYILYLFLFVRVLKGSAMCVAKGSALSGDVTDKLLAGTRQW